MAEAAVWEKVAAALRELHRGLLDAARRDYEREWATRLAPGELLQLLATNPRFAWLRSLSELMVEVDALRDERLALTDEAAAGARRAIEGLLSPPRSEPSPDSFAARYWSYVRDDPHVAMLHAGVKLALASWPLR